MNGTIARAVGKLLGCVLLLGLASPGQAATVEYIHTDALGSPVAVTNSNGVVIERREYEPYGRQLSPTPVADGPGYTGHVSDAATGLDYMQQRYYDPGIGRFLSIDPVTANGNTGANFNRYWYANNSPYKFTDPDGRESSIAFRVVNDMTNGGPINAPPRSPNDWLGPAIGIALGGMLLAVPDPTDIAIGAAYGRAALALDSSKGLLQARRYIEAITDGFERTGGRSSRRTLQANGVGGERGASKLFDRLTQGNSKPVDGGGRLGSLGDGSRVQINSRTLKDGAKETNVRIISDRTGSHIKDITKVRFKEK